MLAIVHDRRDAELAELGRSIRKLTHDLRNTMVSSRLMSDRLRRDEHAVAALEVAMDRRGNHCRGVMSSEARVARGSAISQQPCDILRL